MTARNKIPLPDGTCLERLYDNALIMSKAYHKRYEELMMNHTREGIVLVFIIFQMNDKGEYTSDLGRIATALGYSRASVARAVKLLKDKYKDLVTVSKEHGVSKFFVDSNKCFIA